MSQRRTGTLSGASSQARRTLPAHAPPLRGPGPARPLPGTEAIRRAHFRLGHRAPGRGGRRARPVSGCVNSAFLNISQPFYGPIFSVHGYPTQRAANTSCPRSGRFWLYELRVSRTFLDILRPSVQAMDTRLGATSTVDPDDSPRSCSTNNLCRCNKSERKGNMRQPQLCSSPRRGHCRALPGGSAGPRPPEDRLPRGLCSTDLSGAHSLAGPGSATAF